MSEFCSRCVELEAQIEIIRKQNYEAMIELENKLKKLQDENDALIMDVAFYGGNIINLSCNDK